MHIHRVQVRFHYTYRSEKKTVTISQMTFPNILNFSYFDYNLAEFCSYRSNLQQVSKAWHRRSEEPLSEPTLALFTDTYMQQ